MTRSSTAFASLALLAVVIGALHGLRDERGLLENVLPGLVTVGSWDFGHVGSLLGRSTPYPSGSAPTPVTPRAAATGGHRDVMIAAAVGRAIGTGRVRARAAEVAAGALGGGPATR